MTPLEWLTLIGIVAAGATAMHMANRQTIESLVGKRLDRIDASITGLTESSNDHSQQLVRHETILELHGLLERPANLRGIN